MFAQITGIVSGLLIFYLYFAWRGVEPALETLLGAVLALLGGAWVWWLTDRKLRARAREIEAERSERQNGRNNDGQA